MKRSIAVVLAAALAAPASADPRGDAVFTVAVTVPVRIALQASDVPTTVDLTAQDIARGYKDIAVRYRVRHNDRNGYALEISTLDPARAVEVRVFDEDSVATGVVVAMRRTAAPFDDDLALRLRLVLDPTSAPGTFALPLAVVATPL